MNRIKTGLIALTLAVASSPLFGALSTAQVVYTQKPLPTVVNCNRVGCTVTTGNRISNGTGTQTTWTRRHGERDWRRSTVNYRLLPTATTALPDQALQDAASQRWCRNHKC